MKMNENVTCDCGLNVKCDDNNNNNNNNDNNNNDNKENISSCKNCTNIHKNIEDGATTVTGHRRRLKNIDRSLTINIPQITEKSQQKMKRSSSSVIRRSPNNKVIYRTLTPSCPDSAKRPLSMRPPTPYFSTEDTDSGKRQFSFEYVGGEMNDDTEEDSVTTRL